MLGDMLVFAHCKWTIVGVNGLEVASWLSNQSIVCG